MCNYAVLSVCFFWGVGFTPTPLSQKTDSEIVSFFSTSSANSVVENPSVFTNPLVFLNKLLLVLAMCFAATFFGHSSLNLGEKQLLPTDSLFKLTGSKLSPAHNYKKAVSSYKREFLYSTIFSLVFGLRVSARRSETHR